MIEAKTKTTRRYIPVGDFAHVSYDVVLKLGKIEWLGKATTEEYQSAFLALLEVQEKLKLQYFLSDITKQGVVSPDNRKWFETVALPRAIKQGVKKAAVVMDGNVFKKYYVNMVLKATNRFGLPLKMVSNEEEALLWFNR